MTKKTRSVVSSSQLIPAIRHQGYHTTYALAELIDNSIQACAKNIEILCMNKKNIGTNTTSQLQEIAILDDGNGMTPDELWNSIRLGESTNRGKGGIGRFGVGLTHASFSQCMRVDVYSWKKENDVFHIHCDLDNLGNSVEVLVEEPIKSEIPNHWKKISKHMSKTGTLVVWSKLDRCKWKKANSLVNNSEFLLGRIYRKFLEHKKIKIRMISFDGKTNEIAIDKMLYPNDPLYLMEPSSTPTPWDKTAMFQTDGSRWEVKTPIADANGKEHDVITRYSFAKKEAREGKRNAGSEPHGKHAAENLGISIIRANRELRMDTNMTISYDPVERWWGAEIEFPPELDEVFGVSSNKQTATELVYLLQQAGKQNREITGRDDIKDDEDNPLFELVQDISSRIVALRANVEKNRPKKQSSSDAGSDGSTIKEPPPAGPTITAGQQSSMSKQEREEDIQKLIKNLGIDTNEVWPLDQELRFEHAPLSGRQFFDLSLRGGIKVIVINTNHKAYKDLLAALLYDEIQDPEQRLKLLQKSADGFRKFLASWARLEDSAMNPKDRNDLADIRYEWGKILEKYFEVNED